MKMVSMPVLPVFVIVQAGHDNGATCTAASCCREGVQKQGAVTRKLVDVRSYRYRISVATQCWALVIRYEKYYVFLSTVQ